MSYAVHSKFHNDFASLSKRCEKWTIGRLLCWPAKVFLPWIAYSGLFISAVGISMLPFQILSWCDVKPPSISYWVVATLFLLGILFLFYCAGRYVLCRLRQHLIDIEGIVGFAGFGFGALFAAYIFPSGWHFNPKMLTPNSLALFN